MRLLIACSQSHANNKIEKRGCFGSYILFFCILIEKNQLLKVKNLFL